MAPSGALANNDGFVAFEGRVYDAETCEVIPGCRVYALHIDTNQVYTAAPTDSRGRYALEGLPGGYYDLVVEFDGEVFLGNRVVEAASAGETSEISLSLGDPLPEDTEWWSADPDRRIAGLAQAPSGVARIIEGGSCEGVLFPPQVAQATPATATTAGGGASFWSANASWIVPALAAVGATAAGSVLTDDNDDNEDAPGSPFE
jgi:hypothetical protein